MSERVAHFDGKAVNSHRVLIATWDGGGNTPAAFGLGARLVDRGERVRMIGWESMSTRAAGLGLEFVGYPSVEAWPDGVAAEDDFPRLKNALWGAGCRVDIEAAADAFGAEVVLIDCMLRAGFEAAHEFSAMTVALVHLPYQRWVHVSGDKSMETNVAAMLSATDLILAVQVPGFDEPCQLPHNAAYVGPIVIPTTIALDEELLQRLAEPGDPWVLVSLSTSTQKGQREALTEIVAGLAEQPVRQLLTLGGTVSPGDLTLPGNAVERGFVPHEHLLPHVAAVITHAGMSTVGAALTFGVPMVCVPQGRDQVGNANRVQALGAGIVATPGTVSEAVSHVVGEPQFHATAARFAEMAAPLGQGAYATDLVELLAREGRAAVEEAIAAAGDLFDGMA